MIQEQKLTINKVLIVISTIQRIRKTGQEATISPVNIWLYL